MGYRYHVTTEVRPPHLGPAHPLALIVLALVLGGAFVAAHASHSIGEPDWYMHAMLGVELMLLPPLYGFAHNKQRGAAKTLVVVLFLAAILAASLIYLDLVPPREHPIPGGFSLRPEMPIFYLPPALLGSAGLLILGHWFWTAVKPSSGPG